MVANGSKRAEDDLLRRFETRFRRPLMSYFLRRVGNRAEAEDLTQDAFVRLMGAVDSTEIKNGDAFVFKIAANLLNDRARRTAIRNAAQLAEVDENLISTLTREFLEDRHPERVLLARAEIAQVLKALDELGGLTKDIYMLFRLEGMKQAEIAALYGLTVKSVEKHVMKATMHLALRFQGHDT